MMRITCIVASSVHLLALAISTYIAAIEIHSILVTGWICSITGLIAGISAIYCKRPLLAKAALATPVIALVLFLLEAFVLNLGPDRSALPFCIVFILNQAISTLVILIELNLLVSPAGARRGQITLRTLVVAMGSFSVFLAIARQLLVRRHDWLMVLALALLGLTFVGLSAALFTAIADRRRKVLHSPVTATNPELLESCGEGRG